MLIQTAVSRMHFLSVRDILEQSIKEDRSLTFKALN